jgi:iron(III) transport system ATP-binding protein
VSSLSIADLSVELGGQPILKGVSLEVAEGELAVIVGPSGCGKSTLLRAVAGLTHPTAGRIQVAGTVLSDGASFVRPERRRIGWLPQAASLFPHLTVAENVAFGLGRTGHRATRAAANDLSRELLMLTGLSDLAARYPDQLSGGQAQRVALARALAAGPDLLLLDEPFAALDPQLRAELREELGAMLHRLGVTAVLVTHDQAEALLVADSVVVMRDGTIAQQGSPVEVYRTPASAWVADFLGEANFVEGFAVDGFASTLLGPIAVQTDAAHDVIVMLRPEQLQLGPDGVRAHVTRVRYGGHDAIVELVTGDAHTLLARVAAAQIPSLGDATGVQVVGAGVAYPRGSVQGMAKAPLQ